MKEFRHTKMNEFWLLNDGKATAAVTSARLMEPHYRIQ
jgi:hypothetical protein